MTELPTNFQNLRAGPQQSKQKAPVATWSLLGNWPLIDGTKFRYSDRGASFRNRPEKFALVHSPAPALLNPSSGKLINFEDNPLKLIGLLEGRIGFCRPIG